MTKIRLKVLSIKMLIFYVEFAFSLRRLEIYSLRIFVDALRIILFIYHVSDNGSIIEALRRTKLYSSSMFRILSVIYATRLFPIKLRSIERKLTFLN